MIVTVREETLEPTVGKQKGTSIARCIGFLSESTLPLPLPSREGDLKPSPLAGEGRERGHNLKRLRAILTAGHYRSYHVFGSRKIYLRNRCRCSAGV